MTTRAEALWVIIRDAMHVGVTPIEAIDVALEVERAAGYAEAIEKAALEADAEGKRRIMGPTTDGLAECRKIAKAIRALAPATTNEPT